MPILLSIMSIVIVLSYFGVAWHLVGRDPQKNTLPPTDKPPAVFCPAAAYYLWTLGDIKFSVAAALLSMAVKGFLIVEEPRLGMFRLQRKSKNNVILSPAEQAVAKQLFPHEGAAFYLTRSECLLFLKAEKALKLYFLEQFQNDYFHSNTGIFGIGALISIGLFFWQFPFHITSSDPLVLLSTAGIAVFSYAGAQVSLGLYQEIKSFGAPGLLSLFIVGSALVLHYVYGKHLGTMTASVTMAALALINAIFFDLLKAPTLKGREILDQLEGLRVFLEGGQGESVDLRPPPKASIQHFERYLPYAIVLGRAEIWTRRYASVLSKAKKQPQQALRWYRGDRAWDELGYSFSYSFFTAVRIASTPRRSPS